MTYDHGVILIGDNLMSKKLVYKSTIWYEWISILRPVSFLRWSAGEGLLYCTIIPILPVTQTTPCLCSMKWGQVTSTAICRHFSGLVEGSVMKAFVSTDANWENRNWSLFKCSIWLRWHRNGPVSIRIECPRWYDGYGNYQERTRYQWAEFSC